MYVLKEKKGDVMKGSMNLYFSILNKMKIAIRYKVNKNMNKYIELYLI